MSDEQLTDAEVLRQLDEANEYRDIIIGVLPRIPYETADDLSLRIRDHAAAQVAERDAEIAELRKRVAEADQIVRAGEAERKALAAQVAELQAWKDAVPVDAITEIWYSAYARTGGNDDSRTVAKWFASIGVVTSD